MAEAIARLVSAIAHRRGISLSADEIQLIVSRACSAVKDVLEKEFNRIK